MDKLAPMLIRRAAKKNYIAVIIDPIYKVITGDENSADQMANFCKSRPMDKLAPMLIRRAAKKNYIAVIIDPIYKVITGDENSADQMANFCNQFDKVCTELKVATIYCHHHSKGSQGGKKSMDRAGTRTVRTRWRTSATSLTRCVRNLRLLPFTATTTARAVRAERSPWTVHPVPECSPATRMPCST